MNNTASRIRRRFRNPVGGETTSLRYNPHRGMVSRPMRAGRDVSGHAFCDGADLETCRQVWKLEQDKLFAEGFEAVKTESY